MDITFGIITSGNDSFISKMIDSIESQNIPQYEIIVVGACGLQRNRLKVIPFNETQVPMWITRKKNIISYVASYEIIVFMHDYIVLEPDWYKGFLEFGTQGWDVAMCKIHEIHGTRAMDWMGLPNDKHYGNVLLPYDYSNPEGMYVPGNFWIAKKTFMMENPLDEGRIWGQGEDIEWSKRIFGGADNSEWLRNILRIPMDVYVPPPQNPARYIMNTKSAVRYLKEKPTPTDYFTGYDYHSGDNSRPKGYNPEDYVYMVRRLERKFETELRNLGHTHHQDDAPSQAE